MSDDSEPGVSKNHRGKRKLAPLASSSDSDSSDSLPINPVHKGKYKNKIRESDSDSSIEKPRKKKRIYKVSETESEVDSSGSSPILVSRRSARIISDESDSSAIESDNGFDDNSSVEWDSESETENPNACPNNDQKIDGNFSDSSDGNSEKCPICLLRFKDQEVGSPETCDHSFCADCIHAWSQNVNTCPIDRQAFTLILVRKCLNGKIIRQIPVDQKQKNEEELAPEDPTFCEVCGMSDREDRLLLCDGCDLGYHLECLDPPLEEVPLEEWFCSNCVLNEVILLQNNELTPTRDQNYQRRSAEISPRLVPRTMQSERVRAQIATRRHYSNLNNDQGSVSSGFESLGGPGPSNLTRTRSTVTKKPKKSTKRKTKRKPRSFYYDIDETGKKFKVYKKTKKTKRKTKKLTKKLKRSKRKIYTPKTVKKRLAAHLGMCAIKKVGQNLPDVKLRANVNNNIGFQRSQAGIPTLHLFGQRDQLDYFSESDEDIIVSGGGVNVLSQARVASEANMMRRAARRKAGFIPTPPSVNSGDILGSILNTQEKFLSRNSVMSVNRDGTLNIENKQKSNNNNNIIKPSNDLDNLTSTQSVDLTNAEVAVVQAPMFPGRGGGNRNPYGFNRGGNNYQGSNNMYDRGSYNSYQSNNQQQRGGYSRGFFNRDNSGYNYNSGYNNQSGPPVFRGRGPMRFPMRRPQINHPEPPPPEPEPIELLDEPQDNNTQENINEEVDIYSDIEEGSPTPEENLQIKSPARDLEPAPIPNFHPDFEPEDSEEELVIDDSKADKYDPADPSHDTDTDSPENTQETPLIGPQIIPNYVNKLESPTSTSTPQIKINVTRVPTVSKELLKEAVKGVLSEHLDKKKNEPQDDGSDDDSCPNFSIYSAESIDIAKCADSDIPNVFPEENNAQKEIDDKPQDKLQIDENKEEPVEIDDEENIPEDKEELIDKEIENKKVSENIVEKLDTIELIDEKEHGDEDQKDDSEQKIEENEESRTSDIENIEDKLPKNDDEEPPTNKENVEKPEENLEKPEENDEEDKPSEKTKTPIKIAFDPTRKSKQQDSRSVSSKPIISLYDDSDLEEWDGKPELEKSLDPNPDLEKLTEAISEEERSYTPCLDEKEPRTHYSDDENVAAGIGGLDTELISDDERNEFDESHDMKTISDGDALEINAKESELDIVRPEDYEEGEIIEKKGKKPSQKENIPPENVEEAAPEPKKKKDKETDKEKDKNKDKDPKKAEFKKLSRSNKERNYRDKEREKANKPSPDRKDRDKEREDKENRREERRRKERKRDLERYCVRTLMADKPRKDQFGRDEDARKRGSTSRDHSVSLSPRRSTSRGRRSMSYDRNKKRKRRSRSLRRSRSRSFSRGYSPATRRSPRRSRSPRKSRSVRSRSPRRSKSPRRKSRNQRSISRDRYKKRENRKSSERKGKGKKARSVSRTRRSRSPSYGKHRRNWEKQSFAREWTPSWSRSPSPRPVPRHALPQSMSPSWTPPLHEKGPVQPENLTVILTNNDATKKKKDKKKKSDKKREDLRKRKRTERTPPPSKEVFASGDNILVSVSFNKTDDISTREVVGIKRKRDLVDKTKKGKAKDKRKRGLSPKLKKKRNKTTVNIKPVAIIDLDRSPFKELTPSPKDIIVLSDSDNCEKANDTMVQALQEQMAALQQQNQQDSAPQSPTNYLNLTGPKTPPEPQIKFPLSSKQNQLRAIKNPLHDPAEEQENEVDAQEEENRLNDSHKGPNTPPEPPNSPPSSPDAYDPFEPTKSRSPTPEPETANQTNDKKEDDTGDITTGSLDQSNQNSEEKRSPNASKISPEASKTSPEISQDENKSDGTEKSNKSPQERIGVVINQQVQQANVFPVVKPIISTSVFSAVSASIITSTPTLSNVNLPRANLFNTPSLTNARIAQTVPQRIILPTSSKSSPAKMSPAKPPIKSTPIKPMQTSKTLISKLPIPNVKPITPIRKGNQNKANRNQNGNDVIDVDLDFESPYSPGSSDYEDLFEPPVEASKNNARSQQKNTKSSAKNTFDVLFGSSPVFKTNKSSKQKSSSASKAQKNKKSTPQKHNKTHVGVKIDEDNLKILDDLPNSAVEMQVKDKFLKKLNRQERVVEEVKHVLKPHYNKKHITKEQYKDILRRSVPKICHNKSGEINPKKIQNLIEAYVKKARHHKKAAGGAPATQQPASQPKPAKTTFWS